MLNIEVIRFEAQDVITASKAAPVVVPATPVEPLCACGRTGTHGYNSKTGEHKVYINDEGDYFICPAEEHTCGY